MQSLNLTVLVGRIGTDPETRAAGTNKVTSFSLATESTWKDAKGEKQSKTTWHNIEIWNRENLVPFLKKGNPIHVTGSIENSTYEKDVKGEKVTMYKSLVNASEIGLLDGKKEE